MDIHRRQVVILIQRLMLMSQYRDEGKAYTIIRQELKGKIISFTSGQFYNHNIIIILCSSITSINFV